jgi:hypothetical protein
MVDPWTGVLATDSQSVLKTLGGGDKKILAADEPVRIDGTAVVLDVLCPEWDILIEIQGALEQMPGLRLKFIKVHQDDTLPYAQLPLMARFNVDADTLAGQFQDHLGQDRPIVFLTTRARVLLHLIDDTVTSSIAATLRHAYCGPPLLEYIRRQNQWSEATTESVNWKAHGSALRRQILRRRHYVKFHDILPTNSQKNRMDQGKRTCPCCTSAHEDRDHILRCPFAARNQWRHKLLTTLSEACITHHTYEPLKILLLEAVRQWPYPGREPHHAPRGEHYALELHSLIDAQTRIGWRQLFNERLCRHWADIQRVDLYNIRNQLPTKPNSSHKWQIAIITVIGKRHDLWVMRNADVHRKDEATRVAAEKREVTRKLTLINDQ